MACTSGGNGREEFTLADAVFTSGAPRCGIQACSLGVEGWIWHQHGGVGLFACVGQRQTDFKTNSHLCGPELEEHGSFLHFCVYSLLVQETVVAPLP